MQTTSPTQPLFSDIEKTAKLWAIIRHHLVFISWATMEAALIVPLAYALMQWLNIYQPLTVLFHILLLLLLPHYLSRLLTWLDMPIANQKKTLAIVVLLIIFGTVRAALYDTSSVFDLSWIGELFRSMTQANNNDWHRDFGLFFLISFCWWRGMLLINQEVDISRFGDHFRKGGLYIAPLVLLLAAFRIEWSVISFLLLFLFAGLTAVALTRIEKAERDQAAVLTTVNLRWLITVSGAGFLLIVVSSVISFLISGHSGDQAGGLFSPIWLGAQFVFSTIGFTLLFLLKPFLFFINSAIDWLLIKLRQLFFWVFEGIEVPTEQEPTGEEIVAEQINQLLLEVQREGYTALVNWKLVLLVVLLLLVVITAVLIMRNYRSNKAVTGNGRFGRSMNGLLSRIAPQKRQKEDEYQPSTGEIDWRAALTIRRIYQQMSYYAERAGNGRETNQTPYEYLTILKQLWPNHTSQAQLITQAFVKIRYGELPESQEEFNQIKLAWKQIQAHIKNQ